MAPAMRFSVLLFLFPVTALGELRVDETAEFIKITNGKQLVLKYHKAEMAPPEGASKLYRRSAFIHPLVAPNGGVLTSIHADDHIHHMGLWHAWVKTVHKERPIDFWNLKKGQGTVRYRETRSTSDQSENKGASFTVIQEHVALPDEVVLLETLTVRVCEHEDGHYLVDYRTKQSNVSDAPLELPAYRYGGCLAYRGPLHWNKDNSSVLTSEGKTRKDGHTTRARWCRFTGPTDQGKVSLIIMGHPKNHDAPQRQRIWPPDSNQGAPFYNLVPVQESEWSLQPGKVYSMRYRLVLSKGSVGPEAIEALWRDYTD